MPLLTAIKKVELLANVAIIVAGCALAGVLIKNHLLNNQSKPATSPPTNNNTINGTRLSSLDIDWQRNPQTIVLAISTTCYFCTESAPFYRSLVQSKGSTRLLAVLPQSVAEGQQYLAKLGVSIDEIRQASLSSIGVSGTPTVMLVDKRGSVVNSWVGLLRDTQQSEVLGLMRERAGFDPLVRPHVSWESFTLPPAWFQARVRRDCRAERCFEVHQKEV